MFLKQGLAGISFLLALVFSSGTVLAHGINLFAAAEGTRVEGRVRFHGGDGVEGVRILVKDVNGVQLAELHSAADGRFSYQAQAPVDQVIMADTGDGHQAQWRVSASELAAAFRDSGDNSNREPGDLEAIVERAVASQIRPLREELAAARHEVRFRDVLGGVGYLFGLAGLVLWWRSRREGKGR